MAAETKPTPERPERPERKPETKTGSGEPELSPEGVPYQSSGWPDDRDSVEPGPDEEELRAAQKAEAEAAAKQ